MSAARKAVSRETLDVIRRAVLEEADRLGVRVERVILFGSRARGEASEGSDWDILIVLDRDPGWRVRRLLSLRVRRRLYPVLRAPLDILVYESRAFWERSKIRVSFESAVVEEGVVLG